MTLTHWFLLFGGLTIIAIVIDGVRQMVSRLSTLAIKLDKNLQNLTEHIYCAELPNGGARVVGHTVSESSLELADIFVTATLVELDDVPTCVKESSIAEQFERDGEMPLVVEARLPQEDLEVDAQVVLKKIESIEPAEAVEELEAAEEATALEFDFAAPEEPLTKEAAVEENPLAAAFDPTRPVHEVVESHKILHSDMFADMTAQDAVAETSEDLQVYADLVEQVPTPQRVLEAEEEEHTPAASVTVSPEVDLEAMALNIFADEESAPSEHDKFIMDPIAKIAETALPISEQETDQASEASTNDILLTDTGLDDELDAPADSLGARLAKVTSFSFGKMLLENRRKQVEEDRVIDEQAQVEGSLLANVEQILIIIVVAKGSQGFFGGHLQGLVEACGMVHGSMDLFHRHEDGLMEGQTQFSMANMTQSGAFNLSTMVNVHTAGVVFFMTLPSSNDRIRAFDYMVETAQCLANNLGGELYDENRSVLRAQTAEHYRQRIREFERQRLARRAQGKT